MKKLLNYYKYDIFGNELMSNFAIMNQNKNIEN